LVKPKREADRFQDALVGIPYPCWHGAGPRNGVAGCGIPTSLH
jgi:hypothetical protein